MASEFVKVTARISKKQKAYFVKLGGGDISEGIRRASTIEPFSLPKGLAGSSKKTRKAVSKSGLDTRWHSGEK